jgi:hypothetical protein
MALSWDLHVHPGPSRVQRWGDGLRVWNAAREAGVSGFVWKSHETHTVDLCRKLPPGPPHALASASMNPWATVSDVADALERGARWLWGPTIDESGEIMWNTELPPWWPMLLGQLRQLRSRVVLATGHLGANARAELASTAAELGLHCSVTHSLYLPLDEVESLAAYGCAFEIDAYTYAFPPVGHLRSNAAQLIELAVEHDCIVYATSDGGQVHTGNPFTFGPRVFEGLRPQLGSECLQQLTQSGPAQIAHAVLADGSGQ